MLKKLADCIKQIFRDPDPIAPVDFKISLQAKNPAGDLVAMELHNDDKTPMEFVVKILESYFQITRGEAVTIMLKIHNNGIAYIQWLDRESATLVLQQIHQEAAKRNYPFTCTIANGANR